MSRLQAHPTLWLAFAAGLLSFISPCVLPLYPSYISYISGVSFGTDEARTAKGRMRVFWHTAFFVIGFSIIFLALGLSATLVGRWFVHYRDLVREIGGVVLIVMGISLTGLFTPKFMMMERKWSYRRSRVSYLTSVLIGISFAAGWTPCIGPILAGVLVMAASQSSIGIALIVSYIVGFAIPFFILALTLGTVRKLAKYGMILSRIGGYLMIIMGVLLVTNEMTKITVWLIRLYGGFTGF